MCDLPKLPLDHLEKWIGETARSRFIASERLEKRDQRISWIVAMASAYTIILTVLPYLILLPRDRSDLLNLMTVGLSIVTLVSSLVIGSRHDAVNAEQHHRSALELNELKRDLTLVTFEARKGAQTSVEKIEALFKRYSDILQKFSINHETIDYEKLQLDRPQDYPWLGRAKRARMWITIYLTTNVPIFVMIILTVLVGFLVFAYTLPVRLPRG